MNSYKHIYSDYGVAIGDKLTFSVDVNAVGKNCAIRVDYYDEDDNAWANMGNYIQSGSTGRSSVTVEISDKYIGFNVYLGSDGAVSDGTVCQYKCLKIEKGNVATDWTPAPEDIETRMDSAESNLIILSDKITSNVTSISNLGIRISGVEQTATSLTTRVTNVENTEIGGRNIILASNFSGITGYNNMIISPDERTVTFTSDTLGVMHAFNLGISNYGKSKLRNSKVLFSGEYKVLSNIEYGTTNPWAGFQLSVVRDSTTGGSSQYCNWLGGTNAPTEPTDGWVKFESTYNITDYDFISTSVSVLFRDAIGSIQFRNLKIEFGNKATDWTLAPEDIETRVTSAESSITQLSDRITANVTETTSLGTRMSTVEQTASGITTRLTTAENNILDAAKTATNYMNFSTSGLVIGDMTASTLGKNVLIDNDSVDIRNGTTVLSSFGPDTIYLGKNSETSVINLCNGAATMRVKDDTDFRIYTDKRLVMSAYSSMLLDCWRDSTHMTRIAIQSSDPDVSSVVGGVQFTIYQDNIENTVKMLGNDIELKVTDGTNETYTTMHESIFKVNTSGNIVLNSSSSIQIGDSSSYSFGLRLGSTFTKNKSINCYWSDGEVHDLLSQSNNGQTCYLGAGDIGDVTNTNIRGKYVRLYAHEGGGVYLGYSGSTAITSDKNMKKDILDIDDKYIDFFDRLRPITYKYNVGHRDHIGFIAQEVEDALIASGLSTEQFAGLIIEKDVTLNPNYDSSCTDEENAANEEHYDILYSLRYEEFISLLVKKVQDLQKQINELKGE